MLFLLLSSYLAPWMLCVSALTILAPDHAPPNHNVTVNLTYSPSDPSCFFLRKFQNIDGSSHFSGNVANITNFTADTTANITFHHDGNFVVFAFNVSDPVNLNHSSSHQNLAKSQKIQVLGSESPDDNKNHGHNEHSNEDNDHDGNGSSGGSGGSTKTIDAVPLTSSASSSTSLDDSPALAVPLLALAFLVPLGSFVLLIPKPL
ncbi:hypothetical protein IW261DRAFT_723014 [Armillaria novae-zelandiae]|uniref:Uncharacterized protein n=1 Tax=Armillaria novae-zelandiae TaxID=153914 RepID=A0AA39NW64_9AGAR|nr:hypothetical protein IW261DRAFT_723014 [Armillaria novae-zelandiae]